MPINCVHTHLDLIRNLTQGTHFYEKFAVFELTVTLYNLGVCVSGEGGGGASFSVFRRRSVWLKPLHSIHIKAMSEKHIHNMATIFYLYDCI